VNEERGKLLIREQSFPDREGKYSWTITHDEATKTLIIQYNDSIFIYGHREIDNLCSTVTMNMHESLRRYDSKKKNEEI